jgi:hypothetical protein
VLLGNGDGSFAAASYYGADDGPLAVDVGDFNIDGEQDLAVANAQSSSVSVLLGNGDGSFAAPSSFEANSEPIAVAVGDFDSDGRQDVAVVNQAAGNVSLLLGTGTGSLGASQSFDVGSRPIAVAVGDFDDNDGQDLAVANYASNNVSVLLNAPSADPSPTLLTFGSAGSPVPRGTVSEPKTVTVSNNGSAPLVVLGFSYAGNNAGDFFTGNDSCRGKIVPGASCAAQVRFAPQAKGSRSATLSVLSNAGSPGLSRGGPEANPARSGS